MSNLRDQRQSLGTRANLALIGLWIPALGALAAAGFLAWRGSSAAGWSHLAVMLGIGGLLCAASGWAVWRAMDRSRFAREYLSDAMRRVSAGQRQGDFTLGGDDGWSALSDQLREMAAAMELTQGQVEERNRGLEQVIRANTDELRQKNLALAFQNEKVVEANRLKSAFLASVSHELRTPLNAILALSEMLRDQLAGPMNNEQIKQAEMIHRSGGNLLHLINEVLDLSKIEAGRVELKRTKIDIVGELSEVAVSIRPLAEEKGLQLLLETDGAGKEVFVDLEKLRQVFINLLGNAIKFTTAGTITAQVRLLSEPEMLYVEVQDTGPGILPENQHKIFQEFRQVERAASGEKGTGLGLAISRKLVNLHGGDIWVDSIPGVGSRFAFALPLHPQQVGIEQTERRMRENRAWGGLNASTTRGERARVLVLDDDLVEAGVLGRYLRQKSFDVVTAFDGTEAMRLLRREPFDLILVDPFTHGDDGLEFMERINLQTGLKHLPVIVNASREPSAAERSRMGRAIQGVYVKGSLGVRDLVDSVAQILNGKGAKPADGCEANGMEEVA